MTLLLQQPHMVFASRNKGIGAVHSHVGPEGGLCSQNIFFEEWKGFVFSYEFVHLSGVPFILVVCRDFLWMCSFNF